jgi:hypothetical protein
MPASVSVPSILEAARQQFLTQDKELLLARAHERTITFRFGYYLQQGLPPGWKVDCEYNRHGLTPKDVKRFPGETKGIFPDILIHVRGTDEHNLVAIEAKPKWASKTRKEDDRVKLRRLKQFPYGYAHTYLLMYSDRPEPQLWLEEIT